MRARYVITILLLVLPTELTGITTTHHDKTPDPNGPIIVAEMADEELDEKSNSSDSAERQRRLIPYMTFYLTRDYNQPAPPRQQQYHLVPHQLSTSSYPDKYIVTANYQPKYAETPPILYQPKITYTPFLESNKLPGGFTPMHTNAQPIRVQVLREPQHQQTNAPNYSSIFDKLLQLKQVQSPQGGQYVVQPQYHSPKLSVATQYYMRNYGTARPPPAPSASKVVTFENYQSAPRYKPVAAKTFIHTYTPATIDIPTDDKVQTVENFESLKTYSQIPSPVTVKDYDHGVSPVVKTYAQLASEEYVKSQETAAERPVKVITVNQKEPAASVIPIKVYQDNYQKALVQERPVKVYQTLNQDSYQKLPSHNQPALPVKVYQTVSQESYQDGPPASVKVYQSLPPVAVDDYQSVNLGEYQKPQTRPVKVYQQIYQDAYQPGDLQVKVVTPQKPQPGTGAVYQTITQDVYQQQPQQQGQPELVKTGGDYQPVDIKAGEVVPQPDVRYQPESSSHSEYPQSVQGSSDPVAIHPVHRPIKPYQTEYQEPEMTTETHTLIATENPHSLSVILKQLQESNTLPQTLTPDNIDNSIKTLVHILNALKHTEKFQQPIVVAQTGESDGSSADDDDYEEDILPGTVTQNFPANTVEGGTPGKPGVDYPAHAHIPQTSFNCKKQRYKGFFGDPDTNCQVWHYCDLNGGQASFLCPNGTIFSQVALTCDWWYNVKCATTTQLYVLNERLYKYILPFTPKFPEDYSGPLVDRYLALKFKEMEEKMKKQKKGKPAKPTEDVQDHERNTLQDIEDESGAETQEHTTIVAPDENKSN